jgi:hypothetical protein
VTITVCAVHGWLLSLRLLLVLTVKTGEQVAGVGACRKKWPNEEENAMELQRKIQKDMQGN